MLTKVNRTVFDPTGIAFPSGSGGLDSARQNIAASATVNLTGTIATQTRNIQITGNTQIDGFAIAAGQVWLVRFSGTLTLKNNANIVTQRNADIQVTPGCTCVIRATADNVVELLAFTEGYGAPFVNVRSFGVLANGTDDSTLFNAALTFVKTTGGVLWVPAGTYRVKNLRLDAGTTNWAMLGAGKYSTILEHVDGDGTLLNDGGTSTTLGYWLKGFTIDCKFSTYAHVDARNGIAIYRRSNVTIEDVHIRDFKYSACLIYDDDNAGGVYGNNTLIGCSCDGLNAGANGFLFVNMDRCSYERMHAKGLVNNAFGPGHGVQFKNRCRYGSAVDIHSENCYVGFSFGGDTAGAVPGPAYNTAANIRSYNCTTGCVVGNGSQYNEVANLYIDQNNGVTADAIHVEDFSIGNTINSATVRNVGAAKRAVRFTNGSTDNVVNIAVLDNINVTGKAAIFEDTAQYNKVKLSRMMNPRMHANGIDALATFTTPADNNSFEYEDIPYVASKTIATDAIAMDNVNTQEFVVDTEAAAAADNLQTITNTWAHDGQIILVRMANDARVVTIVHNVGNIVLSTGANFALPNRRSYVVLAWNVNNSKWFEQYRVSNP